MNRIIKWILRIITFPYALIRGYYKIDFGRSLKCKLGLHDYGPSTSIFHGASHVVDHHSRCRRCGKLKTWVTPSGEPYE
ncbi:MAG: hypothetical protein HYW26_00260 [Candidatus Aenigmarchaeota archaeon]|nr:hypothetical protein [Candidatus Aenigmarchaeota archaeon]